MDKKPSLRPKTTTRRNESSETDKLEAEVLEADVLEAEVLETEVLETEVLETEKSKADKPKTGRSAGYKKSTHLGLAFKPRQRSQEAYDDSGSDNEENAQLSGADCHRSENVNYSSGEQSYDIPRKKHDTANIADAEATNKPSEDPEELQKLVKKATMMMYRTKTLTIEGGQEPQQEVTIKQEEMMSDRSEEDIQHDSIKTVARHHNNLSIRGNGVSSSGLDILNVAAMQRSTKDTSADTNGNSRIKLESNDDDHRRGVYEESDMSDEETTLPRSGKINRVHRMHGSPTIDRRSDLYGEPRSNSDEEQKDTANGIENESTSLDDKPATIKTPARRKKQLSIPAQEVSAPSRRSSRKAAHDAGAKIIKVHMDEGIGNSLNDHDEAAVAASSSTANMNGKKTSVKSKRSRNVDHELAIGTKKRQRSNRSNGAAREPLIELHANDVDCSSGKEHPGNQRYHAKIMQYAVPVAGKPLKSPREVAGLVVDYISAQTPPGRFLRLKGGTRYLLNREELFKKVEADAAKVGTSRTPLGGGKTTTEGTKRKLKRGRSRRSLPKHVPARTEETSSAAFLAGTDEEATVCESEGSPEHRRRSRGLDEHATKGHAVARQSSENEESCGPTNTSVALKEEHPIEISDNDVLFDCTLNGERDNALFTKLLSEHIRVSQNEPAVIAKIIASIHRQDPPGRFLGNGNKSILSERAEQQRVKKRLSAMRAAAKKIREKEVVEEKAILPQYELDTYIEDVAWRMLTIDDDSTDGIKPLPPPNMQKFPQLPESTDQLSCTWDFNNSTRILRGRLKPGETQFSSLDKHYLQEMMERDDIAVITEGHCDPLDSRSWSLDSIRSKAGEKYHHRFRRFKRTPRSVESDDAKDEYEEADKDVCMKMKDYIDYLQKRSAAIKEKLGSQRMATVEASCGDPSLPSTERGTEFSFLNENEERTALNVLEDNLYMLDYDVKKQLPSQYQNFKDNFRLPEFLPGGAMCLMNAVNEAARPDMGPNLYITPPGTFTRFHQDGFGTVDSGHLCMAGYNEVVMFRRLPRGHDRNALNIKGSSLYELPHADKLGKRSLDWPTKELVEKAEGMNYCPIVLILGPGELLHIGKGRFHAFRKLGAETLGENDCHFHLRKEVHAKLQSEKKDVNQLVNVSLAWDWSYAGVTAEGINNEMASTLEFALRNRSLSQPKQSLAIPKLSLISSCETAISEAEKATSQFDIAIGNVDTAKKSQHLTVLRGLLPALEFVVHMEQEAFELAEANGTFYIGARSSWPNSWENSLTFPLDPFGNSDYFCKICYQELSNAYMHCDGCEDLLMKDLNVCIECHSDSKHHRFISMNVRSPIQPDSVLNHTGNFVGSKRTNCGCSDRIECLACQGCRQCSCTCHHAFSFHQRMWDNTKLWHVFTSAKRLVGENRVPFSDEVAHRLRAAMLFTPSGEHDGKKTGISQKGKRYTIVPASLDLDFDVEPYTHSTTEAVPRNHLDISKGAMSFTAPIKDFQLPFIGGTKFEYMTAINIQEFLSKAKDVGDGDAISELMVELLPRTDALQLYRNFIDCEKVTYSSTKNYVHFSPREVDIISYAVTQARSSRIVPGDVMRKKGSYPHASAWGTLAWKLMPYRKRKNLVDKFYIRDRTKNLVDKLAASLANEAYMKHLEQHVAPLFETVCDIDQE